MSNVTMSRPAKEICRQSLRSNAVELKKMQWGSALNALMIHSSKSRSEMAIISGISKGRITRILSGDANLTLETVCKFAHSLGYDVDIAFYNSAETKPYQPWNKGQSEFSVYRQFKALVMRDVTPTTVIHAMTIDATTLTYLVESTQRNASNCIAISKPIYINSDNFAF